MNKDNNYDDINIEEYEEINVSLDDIKKKKMKKRLVGIIKRRRNGKKALIAAVTMILIISITNISSISAIAKNMPIFNKIYEQLGFSEKYLPKSTYIGQSIEEKGVRVTIDNIAGTKRIIMLSLKVEKIDGTVLSDDERILPITAEFGGVNSGSGGASKRIDDKTEMTVLSLMSFDEFPSTGELNLDVYGLEWEFNEGFNLNVDSTQSYNEVVEKNFSTEENTEEIYIKSIQATPLGVVLEAGNYNMIGEKDKDYILKIDDKLYRGGSGISGHGKAFVYYPDVSIDDVENAKTISIIELINNAVQLGGVESLSQEEIDKIKEDYEIKENVLKEKINLFPKDEKENIQYIKEMTFNNGNTAEIYNIERGDDIVRVYIKGQDKKQVLEVAMSMTSCDLNESNYEGQNKTIDNGDGYIVEFKDRDDEKFKIDFKPLEQDGSTIGEEILLGSY